MYCCFCSILFLCYLLLPRAPRPLQETNGNFSHFICLILQRTVGSFLLRSRPRCLPLLRCASLVRHTRLWFDYITIFLCRPDERFLLRNIGINPIGSTRGKFPPEPERSQILRLTFHHHLPWDGSCGHVFVCVCLCSFSSLLGGTKVKRGNKFLVHYYDYLMF